MSKSVRAPRVSDHFAGRAARVRAIYDRLIQTAEQFGYVKQAPKKTSIHLARKTAFAGVATRKDSIVLTLKSAADIKSARVAKREQVSAHRWHLDVKLTDPRQVDAQLAGWLKRAAALAE